MPVYGFIIRPRVVKGSGTARGEEKHVTARGKNLEEAMKVLDEEFGGYTIVGCLGENDDTITGGDQHDSQRAN